MSIQEAHAGTLAGTVAPGRGHRSGMRDAAETPVAAEFHPADPAIRLSPAIMADVPAGRTLSGAHVRIDGVADGDAELLLYDLGGTRILPSIDYLPTYGVLDVHFVGLAAGDAYARLLSSLRYINRAPHPSAGTRAVEISLLDADGTESVIGRMSLRVTDGRPAPMAETVAPQEDMLPGEAVPRDAAQLEGVLREGADGNEVRGGPAPDESDLFVVWRTADGALGGTILGWHRAGEDPRHPLSVRPGLSARPDEPLPADGSDAGNAGLEALGDRPIFGDADPHLYGAADRLQGWSGRGLDALSQSGMPTDTRPTDTRPTDTDPTDTDPTGGGTPVQVGGYMANLSPSEPGRVDFLGDMAPEASPALATGGYRIFRAAEARPLPRHDTEPGAHVRPEGHERALSANDLFDGAKNGEDPVAAAPSGAGPRLDAFLIGLPPSGDPLVPSDGEIA